MNRHDRPLSVLLLLASAPAASAGILYVDADLTSGAGDGSSWADAFQGPHGLQAALAAAASGDQVFVAQGTYLPSATGARGASFTLESGVEVYGSFLGTETTPAERPPFGTAPSVLSGDLAGDDGLGQTGENSFQVVDAAGADSSAVLDGFEVRGGNADGNGNNNRGAGIYCGAAGSDPTVRNARFLGNACTFGGGAGYVNASAPSFTDCTFEDNDGGSFGGAFDIATAGAVRFDRCLFARNTADRAGALEVFATTGVVVSNSAFHANVATGTAGGGAIWVGSGGSTSFANCSVVANSATVASSGGLRAQGAAAVVVGSIFWDNSGAGGAQGSANQVTSGASVSYSIVEGGFAGTGNSGLDPLLADPLGGDLTLLPGSPAVDAGDNAGVPAGAVLDLALAPRFADDPSVPDTGAGTAPLVDMGALERQPAAVVYCTAGTSASGCQALLGASGTPSATAASGFTLLASGVEGAKDGLYFFGTNGRQANSWGNGTSFQCVVPPVKRAGLLPGSGTSGACDGSFAQDLNALWCPTCPKPQKNPGPGALVQAQLWYRDPQNTSNQTTSLSDALEFTLQP
jgi:hypothetical protein